MLISAGFAARGPSRALEKRACLLAVLPACGASTAARIKTVLQGRAPWHGPVACVPGQIHSSMVRPPYLSTARVPRPPVSCPPSQRQHPPARWSERLDLIWLLIAAKCGLLKVTSETKKTKSKSHTFVADRLTARGAARRRTSGLRVTSRVWLPRSGGTNAYR